jgi:4'-phosphopantetheinyl transferase EntD
VSHKDSHAVAVVAPLAAEGWRVGIDLERAAPPRGDVAARILTDAELATLAELPAVERGRAVTLRFSIKEAIYKALDPMVQRYIGFREVALQWHDQHASVAPLRLDGNWFAVEVWWTEFDGFWLSTARARRA